MSLHVLLVDDDKLVISATSRMLRIRGYAVTTAANGQEALDALSRVSVDVLLSDLWMPVMDGWRLLEIARDRHPELPVILFSGLHFPEQEARAKELGAVAFLAKPLSPDSLRRMLERIAGRSADES